MHRLSGGENVVVGGFEQTKHRLDLGPTPFEDDREGLNSLEPDAMEDAYLYSLLLTRRNLGPSNMSVCLS